MIRLIFGFDERTCYYAGFHMAWLFFSFLSEVSSNRCLPSPCPVDKHNMPELCPVAEKG